MNKKILDLLGSTAGQLVFALLCGTGYFMVISGFLVTNSNGSGLLAFFFAPAIVCGAALVIIKLMKQARENGNEKAIIKIFYLHIVLILIGIISIISGLK
jgi:Ni/Fe-hydrogenase subunit HybB-like protein